MIYPWNISLFHDVLTRGGDCPVSTLLTFCFCCIWKGTFLVHIYWKVWLDFLLIPECSRCTHLILTTATHRNRIRCCIQWYVKSALQSSSGFPFIIKETRSLIFFLDWSPELLLILSCIKWHWKRLMYILPTSAHHSNPIHHRSLSFRVCCRLSNFLSFR